MSEIYLYEPTTYAVLFEFDADVKESRRGAVKWSDKPAEDGFDISDLGHQPPEIFRVEGIITAWPWTEPRNPLLVSKAEAELRRLRDAMQPVGLITKWWAREVLITNAEAGQDQGQGESLKFSIECQTYRVATARYTEVPASKLKATVKKRAQKAATKGGAAAGKSVTEDKDWIYKIGDALGGVFGS